MKRARHFALAAVALAAGALAALAGDPVPRLPDGAVAAPHLAEWIRARRAGLQIVDTRPAEVAIERLPGAHVGADAALEPDDDFDTVVLYAERDVTPATLDAFRHRFGGRRVLTLHGGVQAWQREVLHPVLRTDASAAQRRDFEARARLSRYFGGAPRVIEPGASTARPRSRGGC